MGSPKPGRICSQDNSSDRRHTNASFTCAVCMGDDGQCISPAPEDELRRYLCTLVICFDGGGGGGGERTVSGGGCGGHGSPGLSGGGQGPAGPTGGPTGGGDMPSEYFGGRAPTFSATVVDCQGAAPSWKSKYFQSGLDREPLRVQIPELPDVFVVSIESDKSLVASGRLDAAILSRKKIAREVQSALIRAAAVHAQVLLDDDDDIDTNPGDVQGHRVARKPKCTRKVVAPVQFSGVRWLVDTGCPMDLVRLADLKGPDRALIAKGGHTHALRAANGATRTAGRVDADVGDLGKVIEAHVLESTPPIISAGKRCMDTGYLFVWQTHRAHRGGR